MGTFWALMHAQSPNNPAPNRLHDKHALASWLPCLENLEGIHLSKKIYKCVCALVCACVRTIVVIATSWLSKNKGWK